MKMQSPRLEGAEGPSSGHPHTTASPTVMEALDTLMTADMYRNSEDQSRLIHESDVPGSLARQIVMQTCTSRKRNHDSAPADALHDVQKFKGPRIPVHEGSAITQRPPLPIDVKHDIPMSCLEARRHVSTMAPQWLCATDVPEGRMAEIEPRAIFNPIPVRIPQKTVSHLLNRPSSSAAGETLVGLAIHSYVLSGRRELVYVVLLDDGQELHIPCGQVEPIMLTADSTSDEKTGKNIFVQGLHLPGHASSEELGDAGACNASNSAAFSTQESWLPSGKWRAFSGSTQRDTELTAALSDFDLSLSEFGAPLKPLQPSLNNAELEQWTHTLQPSEKRLCQRYEAQQESQSVALSQPEKKIRRPSFCDLFHDVLLDHAPQLREAQHPTKTVCTAARTLPSTSTKVPLEHDIHINVCHDASMEKGYEKLPSSMAPTVPPMSNHCAQRRGTFTKRVPTAKRLLEPPLQSPLYSRHSSKTSAVASGVPGRAFKQPASTATGEGDADASGRSYASGPRRGRAAVNGPASGSRASKKAEAAAFAAAYAEETWRTDHTTFVHDRVIFSGPRPGPNFRSRRMPSKQSLFGRFWTEKTLETICQETNRYASEIDPETRLPMGGPRWWGLSPMELRAFMGISLMMGIKRLPNHRAYWSKRYPFLYCQTIATTMSQLWYEDITRCLHVAEDTNVNDEGGSNVGDKLAKIGWLLMEMRGRFKQFWQLHQEVIVDECMVRYKGNYCPIRQYLPKKPTKWGIKVWCLADAQKYYIYDFSVYTGSAQRAEVAGCMGATAKSGYDVVMLLMAGLHGRGHVVVTDNFFTSVKLITDLAAVGTYAAGTVNRNRIGLPKALAQKKLFVNEPRGTLAWRMHSNRKICCVVWVDRQPVLLLSSFYTPLPRLGEAWPTVPRWIAGEEQQIRTSPVHKGYTKYMRGVDVADQMRGSYSSQVCSHKWWHRLFFFLLDTSVVNSYIIYKSVSERLVQNPIEHIDFQLLLAEALCKPWMLYRGCVSRFCMVQPAVHSLVRTSSRKKCRFCFSSTRTNLSCLQCGGAHLHMGECFRRTHYSLRR